MSIHDARRLDDGHVLRADVCIVGAGPAGISLARSLEGRGLDVLLLEGGDETPQLEVQELYAGENVGEDYYPLDVTRLRYLGGATNHWEGYVRTLDPEDLSTPVLGPLGAWPFDAAELADHYAAAARLCEIDDRLDFSGTTWAQRAGAELLPTDPDAMTTEVLLRSPPTEFGRRYRDDLAASADIALHLNANVVELIADGPRISQARIAHFDGSQQLVDAEAFVLATGGIEVPRLLLASRGREPSGIGNQHDLVGRYFMEHPHFGGIQLVCQDAAAFPFYTGESEIDGQFVNPVLTIPPDLRHARGIGNVAVWLMPPGGFAQEYLADDPIAGSVRSLLRTTGRDRPDHLRVQLMTEQVPNAHSRIRLSSERDALGVPRCELEWRLHPVDHHTLRVAAEITAGQLALADVGRMSSATHGGNTPYTYVGGHHHMGTARMHEDPTKGVVDPDGRVHGVDNLYISSSATFPTVGFANPTLTVVAMALRLGDHLGSEGTG
jgi:choline dehydrogenase-like flavoprotein